ncbi:hypothetical protein BH739_16365 [Enterococcus casseliflavus]|nr:hypothetical protein BH739_16365 [Enterococcus casseliflavus]
MAYEYFKQITTILDKVQKEETKTIDESSRKIAEAIMNENSIYIFGASHAGILSEELFYRAGGLIPINPIFGSELLVSTSPITRTSKMEKLDGYGTILADSVGFKENDILIIHSVSGRNPVSIDMAITARDKGVFVIGLTNMSYKDNVESRHKSGKLLFEFCDIVINNHGIVGDAACSIDGLTQKVGATSTVIGAAILNTIVVEACNILAKNKVDVPVFYSANIDGGYLKNKDLLEKHAKVIHYQN